MLKSNILPIHSRLDIKFSYGKGVYLYDVNDKKYLDFGSGIAVNIFGHCYPKLVETLKNQAEKLWHISNLYQIEELEDFARNITKNTFADYAFLCNSGSEAVECGIKMVRKYFYNQKKPEKNRIITFKGAFHGRSIAIISASQNPKYLEGFAPFLEGFDQAEFNNINSVAKLITNKTAAILIEPIQGEQGIRVADKKFITDLRRLASQNNLLLFFDEVQSGVGRTGHLYAYDYYGVKPDIVSSAKGLGGGFPVGACLATKEAASGMGIGSHGTTYGGNPIATKIANFVINEVLKEGFLDNVNQTGLLLKERLSLLQKEFPKIIDEIRGLGLMLGIKINIQYSNLKIVENLAKEGLLVIPAGENVIRILPPLIIKENHIEEFYAIIKRVLETF
ncbi:MAG: acetylornithine/N-succinyldiaminopimelate aminotransferase [Rickettsiales bacterium]|jgi:acetylornithine/N-succinyldiaminopimelate aminotransferase